MKNHSAHFIRSSSERIQKETMLSGTVLQNEKNKSTRSGISLRAKIFMRFIIISILGYVTVAFFDSPYWLTGIWTLVIAIALLNNTLKLVDQADRKLVTFLQSLRQNDFSITFTDDKRSSHYDLHDAFNQLNEKFRSLRSEKESQHQLLQIIVQDAAVPLICFDELTGEVYLSNRIAQSTLNVPFIQNINSLGKVDQSLVSCFNEIMDGEQASHKLIKDGKSVHLSITSRHVVFNDRNLKVIAMHDVTAELAAKEAATWQNLLKVLTHEISNSAIPLSTLSSHILEVAREAETLKRKLKDDEWTDVLRALKAIDERSSSLKVFVQKFKTLNHIPEPEMRRIPLKDLVDDALILFAKDFKDENIRVAVKDIHPGIAINADKNLSALVLINIIKNAIEAMRNVSGNKSIEISVHPETSKFLQLRIQDKGHGIPPESIEQIFIPFYSTKKGGSGIGLSISKQIMQKQKGDITAQLATGDGMIFSLTFLVG